MLTSDPRGVIETGRLRVEFEYEGRTMIGTVLSGGEEAHVLIDGGREEFDVPAHLLRPTTVPPPRDPPHPMDIWDIRAYRHQRETSEQSIAFACDILYGGRLVMTAGNDGAGGRNLYRVVSGIPPTIARRLEDDAHAWLMDHGMPGEAIFEAADAWLAWKANDFPFGVTAADMIGDLSPRGITVPCL